MDEKIKELTEKEELLNYFEKQNEISLALLRTGKPVEEVGEVDDTEYVAEPGMCIPPVYFYRIVSYL